MLQKCLAVLLVNCLFISGCSLLCQNAASKTIYIQPFYPFSYQRAEQVATEVHQFYHCKVVMLPVTSIYTEAKSASGRYSAEKLLVLLNGHLTCKNAKILALASDDIFCEKNGIKEWGIFGLGNCPGDACVVSDFRLKKFKTKTDEFTINIALHELGHTFGLPHCNYSQLCLMNDAKGTIQTLYKEKRMLCPRCARKIGLQVGE